MDQFFKLHDPKKLIAADYIYYARILRETGNEPAAMESYRKAILLDPSKTELYEELAKLSSKNKRHSEAAGYFKKMAETGSDKVVASFQAGKEYFFEGESWKSKYDSLMNIQKTGKNRFADSLAMKKNMIRYYSLADSAFSVVNKLNPEYAGGFVWKGRMQALLDPEAENDGARNAYEKALLILLKGDLTKNRKMIIECYKYMGSWYYLAYEKYEKSDKQLSAEMRSKSVEFFTRISELDPADAQAKAVLAKMKGKKL
jgi:tetratricopeptide (TPR) repeat protein